MHISGLHSLWTSAGALSVWPPLHLLLLRAGPRSRSQCRPALPAASERRLRLPRMNTGVLLRSPAVAFAFGISAAQLGAVRAQEGGLVWRGSERYRPRGHGRAHMASRLRLPVALPRSTSLYLALPLAAILT